MSEVDDARRELRLRLGHALGHSYERPGVLNHSHLNVDRFMHELENFIDAKIDEAMRRKK